MASVMGGVTGEVGRVPCWLVRRTVAVLPAGPTRTRYQLELLAELHDLPRRRQLREAVSLLLHCAALRGAVSSTDEVEVLEALMFVQPTPLICHLHHKLRRFTAEDGTRYRMCGRCGQEHYDGMNDNTTWASIIGVTIGGPTGT